jgi:hypothetical protein
MTARPWVGDLALAILLAIPTAALATTGHSVHDVRAQAKASGNSVDRSPVDNRFSLFAPN